MARRYHEVLELSPYESRPLHRPVRLDVVASLLGRIAGLLALFGLAPVAVSVAHGAWTFAAASAGVALVFGALAWAARGGGRLEDVRSDEALAVAGLAFLLAALAWSLPLASTGLPFVDAFFESVSGITTTGLSTVAEESIGPSHLFLRSWLQWIGGFGIVVMVLALFPGGSAAMRRMSPAQHGVGRGQAEGAQHFVRRVLGVYAGSTAIATVVSIALGVRPLPAAIYALSAVSTGGFAPDPGSLADVDSGLARSWILLVSTLGAVPFVVLLGLARGQLRRLLDPQALALVAAGAVVTAIVAARLRLAGGAAWPDVLRDAPVLAFSAQTTTGFTTVDPGGLDALSKLVLTLSMAIGGARGSTAGGLKLATLLTLYAVARARLRAVSLPSHAVQAPHVGRERLDDAEVRRAAAHVSLVLLLLALLWCAFLGAGYDPLDALFDVVSAVSTVGLSTGVTSPALAPSLKLALCAGMLLGRLELIAFLVLFSPRTWIGRRRT